MVVVVVVAICCPALIIAFEFSAVDNSLSEENEDVDSVEVLAWNEDEEDEVEK